MEGADYDTLGRFPDYRVTEEGKQAYHKKCRECAETALKFLNKSKEAKKVGGYELVEAVGMNLFTRGVEGFWHHANFMAKPKNAPEDEPNMFFAELNHRYRGRLKCIKCCSLGTLDYGSQGCKACELYYPKLRHPQNGFHIGFPGYAIRFLPANEEGGSS